MPNLPERVTSRSALTPIATARATLAQRRAEVELFEHGLRAAVAAEKDQLDSRVLADVITYSAEEELRFLDYGLAAANGSAAKLEIVARKTELMSQINNRRISRRFGR